MFSRSLTIFSVRGIPVRLHWSLLVLLPFLIYAGANWFLAVTQWAGIPRDQIGLPPLAWGVLLALGLFVSIVLHELAHALVGRRSGAKIRSITLMMLGGVTRMETETRPDREAWMALVGPLTSLALAVLAYAVYRFVPLPGGAPAAVVAFAGMNLLLGGFNLLPAFPMDGGRVLRGLLARRIGRRRDEARDMGAHLLPRRRRAGEEDRGDRRGHEVAGPRKRRSNWAGQCNISIMRSRDRQRSGRSVSPAKSARLRA